MAGTVNKVILIGHLGDEVKMHYFDEGNCLGRFPLATNETYTNKQTGEKVSNTEWHNVVVRNKLAEICEKYLTKGDKIYCEGRLKTRQWNAEDGTKRYSTEIHVIDLTFLSNKKELDSNRPTHGNVDSNNNVSENNEKKDKSSSGVEEPNDDLPF